MRSIVPLSCIHQTALAAEGFILPVRNATDAANDARRIANYKQRIAAQIKSPPETPGGPKPLLSLATRRRKRAGATTEAHGLANHECLGYSGSKARSNPVAVDQFDVRPELSRSKQRITNLPMRNVS